MEDNPSSSTDDEIYPSNDKYFGKKLKLNDGSSQDTALSSISGMSGFEMVDSGVSLDKFETRSSSSEEPGQAASEGPSNEVVDVAPSGSNVRAILLNLRRPKWGRNYRKRKTPDRDTDSNASSRDSDDLSVDETTSASRANETHSVSEAESDDMRRLSQFLNPDTDSTCSGGTSGSPSTSVGTDFSEDTPIEYNDSEDSDEELTYPPTTRSIKESEESKRKMPPVLSKTRPKHNYLLLREIINREMGLTFPCGKTTKEDLMFERRFYGSLHAIYRMKKLHTLNKHKGCVNSINFHPEGHLLASGSDDTNVVVWDWARNVAIQTIKTGHKSNVFQSKFLFLNAKSQLNIVTCARDGQVRLLQCHPSGGSTVSRRRLASHSRAAHKLHVCASQPHVVISAGEDGLVMQCDVRAEHASRLFVVKHVGVTIPLYSVGGNPREPSALVVAGRDKFVRLYDTRKATKPVAMFCPTNLLDKNDNLNKLKKPRISMMHLTCAVFNHDGTEILGSYNDDDIYLFDVKNDAYEKDGTREKDGYTHRYSGHRNSATYKGVSFFGPKSEFIISGSDCSYIYMWDKKSEAIVQWLQGDMNGVVNCIEPHPRYPVLATSGLDKDIKIWVPKAQSDPNYDGLERVVRENSVSQLRSPLFNDFLPTLYSAWRGENRLFTDDDDELPSLGGNIEFDGNVCTTF